MKKMLDILVLSACVAAIGCATPQAQLRYEGFDQDMKLYMDDVPGGKALGPVNGSKGGAVWDNCTEKATEATRYMVTNAKAMGANAIGNIKWAASGTSTPTCKKGWGWVLLWPFLLTPVFMSSAVSGTAYKVDSAGKKRADLFMIPEDQAGQEALIKKIVSGS